MAVAWFLSISGVESYVVALYSCLSSAYLFPSLRHPHSGLLLHRSSLPRNLKQLAAHEEVVDDCRDHRQKFHYDLKGVERDFTLRDSTAG